MNEQADHELVDSGACAPVDDEDRPMEPLVLSMEMATAAPALGTHAPDSRELQLGSPANALINRINGTAQQGAEDNGKSLLTSKSASEPSATVVIKGWHLSGDIESSDDVTLGCELKGHVSMTGSARIEVLHGARVLGTLHGLNVVVRGHIEGDIDAGGGAISIEEGATIKGKVSYTGIRMSGGEHQMELVHVPRLLATAAAT